MSPPLRRHIQPSVHCNENKWIGWFHRNRKPWVEAKDNSGGVGAGLKRKKEKDLHITLSKKERED